MQMPQAKTRLSLRPPHKQVKRKMPQAMCTARSTDLRSALTHLAAIESRPDSQSLRQSSWGGSKDLTCWTGQLGLQGAQLSIQTFLSDHQPIYPILYDGAIPLLQLNPKPK